MARLKCACGVWKDTDEMDGHRASREHITRMKERNRTIKVQPSEQVREVLIPRPWRAETH